MGIVPIMHQLLFTWRELPPPILRMALLYEFPMAACYLTVSICPSCAFYWLMTYEWTISYLLELILGLTCTQSNGREDSHPIQQ